MEPFSLLGGGLIGAAGSIYNNERNLDYQRQAQDYNKWAQQQTWNREDNAVQRRTADLRAAGLSPTLAAGSSAQAGSPTKIDPSVSSDALGTEGFISGTTRAAQTQQSIAAAEAARATAALNTANIQKTVAETERTQAQTGVIAKEYGLYNNIGGHPKYQDVWGKRATELVNAVRGAFKDRKIGHPSRTEDQTFSLKNLFTNPFTGGSIGE